tara:strand:- start:61 stop:789 length:729 start_codon:yes stop_codon:yes gene_type:complete
MRTKGIGPRGLGIKKNNGSPIGSPAKQMHNKQPIQLDEVVLNAYNRNNLSEDEKKVYNKFYTGKLNKYVTNPDYDSNQRPSKTNKPKIKAEKPTREFRNTQNIKNGGENFVLDAYGAVKMFRDSGASLSEKPNFFRKIQGDINYNPDKPTRFRPHANSFTSRIYVGKDKPIDDVVAEVAHVFPGKAVGPTIKGTYEKAKRFFKEKKMPDKSNYLSEDDFEYKTHTGPNSVENQLLKMYGTKK